ncbi:kinetochore-associated protein 1 [Lampetra planeri]
MWTEVEFLSGEEQSGTRLGCGSSQERGNALYQIDTLLKVSPSEKVLTSPRVWLQSSNAGFILTVDSTVTLLSSNQLSLLLQLQFDSPVDVVGLCQRGHFLVVGESSGFLNLIHVASQRKLMTKCLLQGNPLNGNGSYIDLILEPDPSQNDAYHMFLLSRKGFLWVSNLRLEKLQEALETANMTTAKECQEKMNIKFISTQDVHTDYNSHGLVTLVDGSPHLIIAGKGDMVLSEWKLHTATQQASMQRAVDGHFMNGAGIQKCLGFNNFIFTLDDNHTLSMWDVCSLVLVWQWPPVSVQDFGLVTDGDLKSAEMSSVKLVIMTTPSEEKVRFLQVFSLPAMEQLYSLEVTNHSFLARAAITQEAIYLLEGMYEGGSRHPDGAVSMLVLRHLTEALPENRLSRLLYMQQFEEAEKFAIHFHLDVEVVYNVKVTVLLQELTLVSPSSKNVEYRAQLAKQARATLEKIQDDSAVVRYCLDTCWPSFDVAVEVLSYCKSRITKGSAWVKNELMTEVLQVQDRLMTFHGAFGANNFSGPQWLSFKLTDLFTQVLEQLEQQNLASAQFIWLRHQVEFEKELDCVRLKQLLAAVPRVMPSCSLLPWLATLLVPCVRRRIPGGQKILAKWLDQRARSLELTEKQHWPENGLQIAEVFFTAGISPTQLDPFSAQIILSQSEFECKEVQQLQALVHSIQELLALHRKYSCPLSLSNFEKETRTTIVFRMLDQVAAPQLVAPTLERVVRPYLQERGLAYDSLLVHYIKDLLERCSSRSMSLFETAWEAKAMAVVACMSDTDLIFDAVLQIMYKAVVPWSQAVQQLVQEHMQMHHPKVKLLQDSYRMMEMKMLLRRYGIRNFNLSNDKQADTLVRCILRQDLPLSFEDALKVTKAYMLPLGQTYLRRAHQLLVSDRMEECVELLQSLPLDDAMVTGQRLLQRVELELQSPFNRTHEGKAKLKKLTEYCIPILKFLILHTENVFKLKELNVNLNTFQSIYKLQHKFGIYLSCEEYECSAGHSTLLAHFSAAFTTESDHLPSDGPTRGPPQAPQSAAKLGVVSCRGVSEGGEGSEASERCPQNMVELHELAALLGVGRHDLARGLAGHALSTGKVQKAIDICRGELDGALSPHASAELAFWVVQQLSTRLENDEHMEVPPTLNLPAEMHTLCQFATAYCHPDILLDCLELSKNTRVALAIYEQCQTEDYGFVAKDSAGADKDPYQEWTFEEYFREDGIVLDPVQTLPVVYELTALVGPRKHGKRFPLDCTALALRSEGSSGKSGAETSEVMQVYTPLVALLHSLREASQLQLALMAVLRLFAACHQHIFTNIVSKAVATGLHGQKWYDEQKTLLFTLTNTVMDIIKPVALALVHKVLNSRAVDKSLALSYCLMLHPDVAFEKLWSLVKNAQNNYPRILSMAVVGGWLAEMQSSPDQAKCFAELYTDAQWGVKLSRLGVAFHSVFCMSHATKGNLIPALVSSPNMDSDLLLQYCSEYGLESDAALQQYIETLLLLPLCQSGDLVPAAAAPPLRGADEGGDAAEEERRKAEQARRIGKAFAVIPCLSKQDDFVLNLTAKLHKLSPYDYNGIEVILKAMQVADSDIMHINVEQALELLRHLNSYRRISPPGKLEEQGWTLQIAPLAATRLPFHLLPFNPQHFWTVITPELSEDTLPTLVLIAKLLKMPLDKLYLSAIKHVFEKSLKPKILHRSLERTNATAAATAGAQATRVAPYRTSASSSCLTIDKEAMDTVQKLYSYVLAIQNPEWANAIASCIAHELPSGPEKVHVLNLCIILAQRWLSSIPKGEEGKNDTANACRLLEKMTVQYRRSATENCLNNHGLSSLDTLSMLSTPAKLIVCLYDHASILERAANPMLGDYPDIHAAVNEIGEVNKTDVRKIRVMLLQQWLNPPSDSSEQWGLDGGVQPSDLHTDSSLAKIMYLLQTLPLDYSTRGLITIANGQSMSDAKVTYRQRARALHCLLRLADAPTIESITKQPLEKVRYDLHSYLYLAQFEALSIPYTVDSFHNSSKEGLIKGLWKNHNHEPRAVRLVAELSLDFGVYDLQLWSGVLQKLLAFNMIDYLRVVLVRITPITSLWQVPNFAKTWRSVISTPLIEASCPLTPKQKDDCHHSFLLLLRCPVLADLDLLAVGKMFSLLGQLAFTLGSLLLVPVSQKRTLQLQGFLSSCCLDTLLTQVSEDVDKTEFSGLALQLRNVVLSHVFEKSKFERLLGSAHWSLVLNYAASVEATPRSLLAFLSQHGRRSEAVELLNHKIRRGEELDSSHSPEDLLEQVLEGQSLEI